MSMSRSIRSWASGCRGGPPARLQLGLAAYGPPKWNFRMSCVSKVARLTRQTRRPAKGAGVAGRAQTPASRIGGDCSAAEDDLERSGVYGALAGAAIGMRTGAGAWPPSATKAARDTLRWSSRSCGLRFATRRGSLRRSDAWSARSRLSFKPRSQSSEPAPAGAEASGFSSCRKPRGFACQPISRGVGRPNRRVWPGEETAQGGIAGCAPHLRWGGADERMRVLNNWRRIRLRELRARRAGGGHRRALAGVPDSRGRPRRPRCPTNWPRAFPRTAVNSWTCSRCSSRVGATDPVERSRERIVPAQEQLRASPQHPMSIVPPTHSRPGTSSRSAVTMPLPPSCGERMSPRSPMTSSPGSGRRARAAPG